jgi:hypothetical protein
VKFVRKVALMDWTAFLSGFGGSAVATGILGILLKSWIDHRLTTARDAAAREGAVREKRREESRAVAEILSEWVRSSYTGQLTNEDRWKLQTVYWKNILGLDRAIIEVLFPRLANLPDAPSTDEVIVQARRILLGLDKADVPATGLNHWLPEPKANP